MKKIVIVLMCALLVLPIGCANMNKTTQGGLLGGGAGAVLGGEEVVEIREAGELGRGLGACEVGVDRGELIGIKADAVRGGIVLLVPVQEC